MFPIALPVLLLMLSAGVVGILTGWAYRRVVIDSLKKELQDKMDYYKNELQAYEENKLENQHLIAKNTELIQHKDELDTQYKELQKQHHLLKKKWEEMELKTLPHQEELTHEINRLHLLLEEQKLAFEKQIVENSEKQKAQIQYLKERELKRLKSKFAQRLDAKQKEWIEKFTILKSKLTQLETEKATLERQLAEHSSPSEISKDNFEISESNFLENFKKTYIQTPERPLVNEQAGIDLEKESITWKFIKKNKNRAKALEIIPENIGNDDLSLIFGIDRVIANTLHHLGIKTFQQIALFDEEDISWLSQILNVDKASLQRWNWPHQARNIK